MIPCSSFPDSCQDAGTSPIASGLGTRHGNDAVTPCGGGRSSKASASLFPSRPGSARVGRRRRIRSQQSAGVVVRTRILGVHVLWEDDERARRRFSRRGREGRASAEAPAATRVPPPTRGRRRDAHTTSRPCPPPLRSTGAEAGPYTKQLQEERQTIESAGCSLSVLRKTRRFRRLPKAR